MEITIGTLNRGAIGFKGTGYAIWNPQTYINSATNSTDWSGLYIAEAEETAKGYLPDLLENKANGDVYIQKVSLIGQASLITCLDEGFKTGHIDMSALKAACRTKGIDVQDHELLMVKLGQLGYYFRCYNNEEGGVEIIVPNNLTTNVTMQQYKVCHIKDYEVESCDLI